MNKTFYSYLILVQKNNDSPTEVDSYGNKYWRNDNGQLHRIDGPAVILADGTQEWYMNDKIHNENGPAIKYTNGNKEWFINGLLHRKNGPAIKRKDGYRAWYINGLLHREDGPAVIKEDGKKKWYLNAKRMKKAEYYSVVLDIIVDKIGEHIAKVFGFNDKSIWGNPIKIQKLANLLEEQGKKEIANQIINLCAYFSFKI